MKKNNSINLADLDVARLSKGIHRYLKSKGCKDIKLSWISEGVARSLGFNNQHDLLKNNESLNNNKTECIVINKDIALEIFNLCLKNFAITEIRIFDNLVKKQETIREYYTLSKECNSVLKSFPDVGEIYLEDFQYIENIYNFVKIIDDNKECLQIEFPKILIKNLIKNGAEDEYIKSKMKKFNNKNIEYNFCFLNLKIPFLIISEENNLSINIDKSVKTKIGLHDNINKIIDDLSNFKIDLNFLFKEQVDLLKMTHSSASEYVVSYILEEKDLAGKEKTSESMWLSRAINLLSVLIRAYFYQYRQKNKELTLSELISKIDYDNFISLINYFEKGKDTKDKEYNLIREKLKDTMECLPGENGSETKKEQYGFLYITIKKNIKEKLENEANTFAYLTEKIVSSEIFTIIE